jgi:hypothetical protein
LPSNPDDLIPQPHGGSLRRGNPGNRGGVGRPSKHLRNEFQNLLSTVGVRELGRILRSKGRGRASDEAKLKAIATLAKYTMPTEKDVRVSVVDQLDELSDDQLEQLDGLEGDELLAALAVLNGDDDEPEL